jgi:GMP reductase
VLRNTKRGEAKNVEGKKIWIHQRGHLRDTLQAMREDLQSSISYAGGRDLEAIRKVDYVIVKNSIFNGDVL